MGDEESGSAADDVVTIYRAKDGWRWRRRAAGNNEIVAVEPEPFKTLRAAEENAKRQNCRVEIDHG